MAGCCVPALRMASAAFENRLISTPIMAASSPITSVSSGNSRVTFTPRSSCAVSRTDESSAFSNRNGVPSTSAPGLR
ncbi:hypothetical protein D3C71_2076460 [compost metagenome]